MSKNTDPARKEAIIFDLDGTITDFRLIDNEIITDMFKSKFVLFLDKILWRINEQDVLKNTMIFLKIRLLLYSIFSGKNYAKIMKRYREEYFFKTYSEFRKMYELLLVIAKRYEVIILSNNEFSKGIEYGKITVTNSKSKHLSLLKFMKTYDIKYFVGNNLLDDILTVKGTSIRSIYVGKSRVVSAFAYDTCDILEFLKSL